MSLSPFESSSRSMDSPESIATTSSASDDSPGASPVNGAFIAPTDSLRESDVRLLHKPRGSQGAWQLVAAGSRLRVPKERGKRLKLEIYAPEKFVRGSVDVRLVDLDRPGGHATAVEPGSLVILSAIATTFLTIDLKVFKMAKRLQFGAVMYSRDGSESLRLTSVVFATHNSGVPGGDRARASKLQQQKARAAEPGDSDDDDFEDPRPAKDVKRRAGAVVVKNGDDFKLKRVKPEPAFVHGVSAPDVAAAASLGVPTVGSPSAMHMLSMPALSPGSDPEFYAGTADARADVLAPSVSSFPSSASAAPPLRPPTPAAPSDTDRVGGVGFALDGDFDDFMSATLPDGHDLPSFEFGAASPAPPMFSAAFDPRPAAPAEPVPPAAPWGAAAGPSSGRIPSLGSSASPFVSSSTIPVTTVDGMLDVNGLVRAHAFMQFSDLRLKTNVADISDALDIVMQLDGKTYEWKNDPVAESTPGRRVIGLIAQEVQRVLPEVVREDPSTGLLSVSYVEILPVMLEAFKQFAREARTDSHVLQARLDVLSAQLAKHEEAAAAAAVAVCCDTKTSTRGLGSLASGAAGLASGAASAAAAVRLSSSGSSAANAHERLVPLADDDEQPLLFSKHSREKRRRAEAKSRAASAPNPWIGRVVTGLLLAAAILLIAGGAELSVTHLPSVRVTNNALAMGNNTQPSISGMSGGSSTTASGEGTSLAATSGTSAHLSPVPPSPPAPQTSGSTGTSGTTTTGSSLTTSTSSSMASTTSAEDATTGSSTVGTTGTPDATPDTTAGSSTETTSGSTGTTSTGTTRWHWPPFPPPTPTPPRSTGSTRPHWPFPPPPPPPWHHSSSTTTSTTSGTTSTGSTGTTDWQHHWPVVPLPIYPLPWPKTSESSRSSEGHSGRSSDDRDESSIKSNRPYSELGGIGLVALGASLPNATLFTPDNAAISTSASAGIMTTSYLVPNVFLVGVALLVLGLAILVSVVVVWIRFPELRLVQRRRRGSRFSRGLLAIVEA